MNVKTILGAVGIVVMGALGSALWELMRPVMAFTWTFFLNIATFGIGTLRDNMYTSAASNLWRSSTGLLSSTGIVAALILLCPVGIVLCILLVSEDRLQNIPILSTFILRFLMWFFLFGASVMMARAIQARYVEQLASYYLRLETIAAPFISDTDMKKLRSKYVQITGRRQYLDHVEKLQHIIIENGIQPPTRDFF